MSKCRDEPLAQKVKEQFTRAGESKSFILLDGDAHAQHIFKTGESSKLTGIIIDFLSEGAPDRGDPE